MERKVHANEKDVNALVDAQLSVHNSDSRIPHVGLYLDGKQIKRLHALGWIEPMPQYEFKHNVYFQTSELGFAAIKDVMIGASFALFMRNIGIIDSRNNREQLKKSLIDNLAKLNCYVTEAYVFEWGNWYENMQVNFEQFNVVYASKEKKYVVGIYSLGRSNELMDVAAFRAELDRAEIACGYMNVILQGERNRNAAQ